jgi:hypothetical protein
VTAVRALRAPVPPEIIALIAAVAIGGTVAGFLAAAPLLLVTTPVVAAGLAAAAALANRKPEWHRVAMDALAQLPPHGQARVLLADLLRRAEAVPAAAHAGPLASAACGSALQLAALELHGDAPVAKRGRALLAQRLQDASAALTRWQAAQGAGESLGELARELNDESRYQQEASHEVELLLA